MKETLERLLKLISSWRDTATDYNHHGKYAAGHSFHTCANELEGVIQQASEPTVQADQKTPCHSCGIYSNDYGTNFCGHCGRPLN